MGFYLTWTSICSIILVLSIRIKVCGSFSGPHSATAMKLMDNASANDTMQKILKNKQQMDLLCGGEFFHVRCSAHILNLIVQNGLAKISGALKRLGKMLSL